MRITPLLRSFFLGACAVRVIAQAAVGVHPNHAGYELLGNLLHEQIVQILN